MANLTDIVTFAEQTLANPNIRDYPGAVNGLQIENSGTIHRVVAAVDASLATIEEAAKVPGTLLIVHHGMFWQGVQTIRGAFRRKIQAALDADLALYSSHLPLDLHPEIGNNILLGRALELRDIEPLPVDPKAGIPMGLCGGWHGTLADFLAQASRAVGAPIHHCPGGPSEVTRVAVITGGAGSEVQAVAASGVDTFITGEGPHWSYTLAEELGINLIYAGHYATETFGVNALSIRIGEQFSIPTSFIDHPTGL